MNILYLTQYFPPDMGAAQVRALEMAQNLVKSGHRVTILTEFPNYPSGVIPARYKFKLFEGEISKGIEVVRCYVKTSPRKGLINRILFYLSFMLTSIIGGMKLKGKYDVVFATSPPLFVGLSGYAISKLKKIRFVFEVRDLWPESIVALEEVKNKTAIWLLEKIEGFCYKNASKVIVVTEGIYDHLTRRGVVKDKLHVIPNGANIEMFTYTHGNESVKQELGHAGKFLVLYSGLLGLAQGIETLVETVVLFRDDERVLFVFMGDGPLKRKVQTLQTSYSLKNLLILDETAREGVVKYCAAADCCLVPLKKAEVFRTALPSKMFEAWASGRPVILSVDGEAREHLEKAEAGIWVEPEDSKGIADAVKYLLENPESCEVYGSNGRKYVEKHFSRKVQAEKLEKILLEVCNESTR